MNKRLTKLFILVHVDSNVLSRDSVISWPFIN